MMLHAGSAAPELAPLGSPLMRTTIAAPTGMHPIIRAATDNAREKPTSANYERIMKWRPATDASGSYAAYGRKLRKLQRLAIRR